MGFTLKCWVRRESARPHAVAVDRLGRYTMGQSTQACTLMQHCGCASKRTGWRRRLHDGMSMSVWRSLVRQQRCIRQYCQTPNVDGAPVNGGVTGMLGACAAAGIMPGLYEYLEPASAEPYWSCASFTCSGSCATSCVSSCPQPGRQLLASLRRAVCWLHLQVIVPNTQADNGARACFHRSLQQAHAERWASHGR